MTGPGGWILKDKSTSRCKKQLEPKPPPALIAAGKAAFHHRSTRSAVDLLERVHLKALLKRFCALDFFPVLFGRLLVFVWAIFVINPSFQLFRQVLLF